MAQERCERFRESLSLGLDGMLSTFEAALLDRHLSQCPSCRAVGEAMTAQTQLLRAAMLEEPRRTVTVPAFRETRVRRHATGLTGALAVAAAAAVLTLAPGHHSSATGDRTTSGAPLLAVYAAQPSTDVNLNVPRLRVVSPASADGPVHGDYGLPVETSV
jgi:predicted anti-sigma-YlaC factor YlaD